MSKSDGLKIGIKFTEDLVGDVSGSEDAFAITGKEYKYVNGALTDKEYQVEKVERYPVPKVWQDNFNNGEKENVEILEQGIMLKSSINKALLFNGTNNYVAIPNQSVLSTWTVECWVYHDGTFSTWETIIGGNGVETYPLLLNNGKLMSYYTGLTSPNPIQAGWTHVASTCDGNISKLYINGVQVASKLDAKTISPTTIGSRRERTSEWFKGIVDDLRVWNTARTQQQIQNNMNNELNGDEIGVIGYWKLNEGEGSIVYDSSNNANHGTIQGATWINGILSLHPESGTYNVIVEINGKYRIKQLEEKPSGTNIKIKIATTENNFIEVNDGYIIDINGELWIKATLSTENTTVTPILKELWLEEISAPQDKILITMDWWGKFNNVEGELTVKYDATKGNLTGAGGAVESFEVEFTPTDLVQTPNPHVVEHLKAYPYEITLDFKEIDRQNRYAEEHLKAYPYEIVLDLKHVSEINP